MDNSQNAAGQTVPLDSLVGCPFCGASAKHLGDGVFSIKHGNQCWILHSGFHCNYQRQHIATQAEKQAWSKRASNETNEGRIAPKETTDV